MIRLAIDENFNNDVVRGLLRQKPELDLVRVQDVGLAGADDPTVLEWAAREGRILLTHDVTTITRYAYERIQVGLPMPGVFEVAPTMPGCPPSGPGCGGRSLLWRGGSLPPVCPPG
ncbi:MAG: DUF5615 family PIN-like protein [Chloroflexi bacterium]|nr:DUF5615 family PIN-like protein [Chloroflexota bacterium]